MLFNLIKNDRDQAANNLVDDFSELEEKWLAEGISEGQLLVDVCQTEENIIVKSPMAGVKPDDLNISLNNDLLTIKGHRQATETYSGADYLYKECYWGSFSRSLVLPAQVDSKKIEAFLENGVLTVVLTKTDNNKRVEIKIKE